MTITTFSRESELGEFPYCDHSAVGILAVLVSVVCIKTFRSERKGLLHSEGPETAYIVVGSGVNSSGFSVCCQRGRIGVAFNTKKSDWRRII